MAPVGGACSSDMSAIVARKRVRAESGRASVVELFILRWLSREQIQLERVGERMTAEQECQSRSEIGEQQEQQRHN